MLFGDDSCHAQGLGVTLGREMVSKAVSTQVGAQGLSEVEGIWVVVTHAVKDM